MSWLIDLLGDVVRDVATTFVNVWPFLAIAVLVAAAIPVYVGLDRLSSMLRRRWWVSTLGAVAFASLTPFCSCGTTAVLLGMIAASSPWAPLIAFMVSSPLTSPSELVFSAGLFGWSFAWIFFGGTIVLGLMAGVIGQILDRAGWLDGQARLEPSEGPGEPDPASGEGPALSSGGGSVLIDEQLAKTETSLAARWRLAAYAEEIRTTGGRIVAFFFAFTALGYLVINAIPTAWLQDHLGGDSPLAVPLAALLGVPAYINTEGSLPLVATMVDNGMGPGPALAFIVTGAGTSIAAVSGLLIIARARVVALVVACLFVGAIGMGWFGQIVL